MFATHPHGHRLVDDRIYTFSGCLTSSSCGTRDEIYYTNSLGNWTSSPTTMPTGYPTAPTVSLESWIEANGTLPQTTRNLAAAYSRNCSYPECIFVFGGHNRDSVYCYNYTIDEMIYWGEMDDSVVNQWRSQPGGVIISNITHDILYHTTEYCHIMAYDLENKTSRIINSQLNTAGWRSCPLVENPLNSNQFLTLNGWSNSNQTAVYDLISNSVTYGKNLNSIVARPFMVAISDDYVNSYPYVYVITGEMNTIEKLDLSKSDNVSEIEWETLNTTLTLGGTDYDNRSAKDWSQIRGSGGIQYENLIYIVGGTDDTSTRDCVIAFDWIDEKIEYVGEHSTSISSYGYA